MANYDGYLYPLPQLYKQPLTGSLDDGLERFDGYLLQDTLQLFPLFGSKTHSGSVQLISHDLSGVKIQTWVDLLFGHVLAIPSRLDMGNLLSAQSRTVEIANLTLDDITLEEIINNAGDGIVFNNAPDDDLVIPSFSNFVLQVAIAANGPPSINGTIVFEFDSALDLPVPVTGKRIVMFPWQPERPIEEALIFKTTVLTSRNDNEQRISILIAPRSIYSFKVVFDEPVTAARMRNTLFDWLTRVFGVPVWHEQRYVDSPMQSGDTFVEVDTSYADFRVGGLAAVFDEDGYFESFEIDSITETQLNFTSGAIRNFTPVSKVIPVRTCYADVQPAQSRYNVNVEEINITFTTLDNIDLADLTDSNLFDSKVIMDDYNHSTGKLGESMSQPVTLFDNKTGRLFQVSRTDRARLYTEKKWKTKTLADLWRVRRLVHALRGSQVSFYLPSFRNDFKLAETIGPGAQSFRVINVGYSTFVNGRKPLAAVRFVLTNGTTIVRKVIDADEDVGGETENINVDASINDTALEISQVYRIEMVWLVRIADDRVTMVHGAGNETVTSAKLISVKA